jgi:hypothetical protein
MHAARGMKYTAKLTLISSGYSAQCVEVDATGEGATKDAAIASLRSVLQENYEHVEGVALPSLPTSSPPEIVVLNDVNNEG